MNRGNRTITLLRTKWMWVAGVVVLALAFGANPSALAGRLQQGTVPPPTPFPTNTPVSTPTPTFTPRPPTNTPVPTATNTPAPGETPPPTATSTPTALAPTETPTITPTPAFSLQLSLEGPTTAIQGDPVELLFTVTNPSTSEVARNVRIRNLLPADLILISAEASAEGEAVLEVEGSGGTVVLFSWETLAPNDQVQGRILAEIAPEVPNGTVIDNLGVAFADNASGSTAGISIGLPPAILPLFN